MWTEIEPEKLSLTPEIAKLHALREHLRGDRDWESVTGKARCAWLDGKIRSGEFYTPTWAVAEYQGKWYRLDGGHSSNTLAAANGHFPRGKFVIVRRFQCSTYEDLLALFNEFDNRRSVRTSSDKIKVHKSAHDDLDGVSPSSVGDTLSGILCFFNDGATRKGDEDEKTKLIHSEREFIAFAGPFARNKYLRKAGALGCMYRGYQVDKTVTHEFWTLVKDASHPDPSHPTRMLHDYFREITGKSQSAGLYVPSDTRAQYVKSIHAWNAWQRREGTQLKYRPDKPVPPMVMLVGGKFKSI